VLAIRCAGIISASANRSKQKIGFVERIELDVFERDRVAMAEVDDHARTMLRHMRFEVGEGAYPLEAGKIELVMGRGRGIETVIASAPYPTLLDPLTSDLNMRDSQFG